MAELKIFHTSNTYTFPDKSITVADQEDVSSLDQELQSLKGNTSDLESELQELNSDVTSAIDVIAQSIVELDDNIETFKDSSIVPWTDVISFTYSGSNNVHEVSFIPNSVGYATLNGVTLNPYYDYQFQGKNIIFKKEGLTEGIEYKAIIQYFKNSNQGTLYGNSTINEVIVDTYADMMILLAKANPNIPTRYFVKSDETNGGVSATYTHFNNALTVTIETDVI